MYYISSFVMTGENSEQWAAQKAAENERDKVWNQLIHAGEMSGIFAEHGAIVILLASRNINIGLQL